MPTSRCSTIERLSSCTTSIGSSIVTMCARRVLLMCPIIEAMVVVLPVPVGPVSRISPRGDSASERMTGGSRSSSKVGVDAKERHVAGLQVQVAGAALHHVAQQVDDVHAVGPPREAVALPSACRQ